MFDVEDYKKLGSVNRMVDNIKNKYGIDLLKRALFLNGKIDHMSGRISREKRDLDYAELKIKNN